MLGGLSVWVKIHVKLWDGYYLWWHDKGAGGVVDVSRPWIDVHVFALPGKFNMSVTESDLDPKVRKMTVRAVT